MRIRAGFIRLLMGEARRRKILGLPPKTVKSSFLKNQNFVSRARGSVPARIIDEGFNDETGKWEPITDEN
jgi:hypothetical protein